MGTKASTPMFQTPVKKERRKLSHLDPLVDNKLVIHSLPSSLTESWIRYRKPFAVVIDNVLTEEECLRWINETEEIGYEDALVNIGGGLQQKMTDIRNCGRCIIDDTVLANQIWERIRSIIPDDFEEYIPRELNERLRFLRYDPGEYFAPHLDGSYHREIEHQYAKDFSILTVQVYLNEGFTGGTTRFFHRNNSDETYDVVPRTGSVLIFEHGMMHSGEKLEVGRKYALRSDIMFTKKV